MYRYFLLVLGFIGAAMAHGLPTAAEDLEIQRDVEFARPDGDVLKLDAYLQRSAGPHPAVIFVHGGGFIAGDKKDYPHEILDPLCRGGFSTFAVNYRLAPKHPFPAATDDVESAVAWIKHRAALLRVDPNRLALLGPSAGGLIVSIVGGRLRPENRVAAVISMFGEHDLVLRASEEPCCMDGKVMPRPRGGCISRGLAALLGFSELTPERQQKLREASAVTYVRKDMPPYLLIHGTRDFGVPFEQSVRMHEAMQRAGADCTLVPIVGGGHAGWTKPEMQHYKATMRQWLKSKLARDER